MSWKMKWYLYWFKLFARRGWQRLGNASSSRVIRYGGEVVAPLTNILMNTRESPDLRREAALCLSRIGDENAAYALLRNSFSPEEWSRRICLPALEQIKTDAGRRVLEKTHSLLRAETKNICLLVYAVSSPKSVWYVSGQCCYAEAIVLTAAWGDSLKPIWVKYLKLDSLPLYRIDRQRSYPIRIHSIVHLLDARYSNLDDAPEKHWIEDIYANYTEFQVESSEELTCPFLITGDDTLALSIRSVVIQLSINSWAESALMISYTLDHTPEKFQFYSEYNRWHDFTSEAADNAQPKPGDLVPIFVSIEQEVVLGALRILNHINERCYNAEILLVKPVEITPGTIVQQRITWINTNYQEATTQLGTIVSAD